MSLIRGARSPKAFGQGGKTVHTDGTTITGDGSADSPLVATAGAGVFAEDANGVADAPLTRIEFPVSDTSADDVTALLFPDADLAISGANATIRLGRSEELSGGDGSTEALSLDCTRHYLTHDGASETLATFTLANGLIDGQIHYFVALGTSSTKIIRITVTTSDESITSWDCNASSSGDVTAGTLVLMWDGETTGWRQLGSARAWGTITGTALVDVVSNVATSRILGRITAGTGNSEELTGAQATGLLSTFDSGNQGVVGGSGGGTTNFLRADGTWAVPPGSGSSLVIAAAAIVSAPSIANTETVIIAYSAGAGVLDAGVFIRFTAWMTTASTQSAQPTFRIRVGPTTLTGNIAATLSGTGYTTATGTMFMGCVVIRTDGAGGTAAGGLFAGRHDQSGSINTPRADAVTAAVAVDTTVTNLVELTLISGSASQTYAVQFASYEVIQATAV